MAKKAWETMVAYKLVWLRVLGYFIVPAWLTWDILVADVSGAQWEIMHGFEKAKIIGKAIAAGVIPFMAFIDNSLPKKREELAQARYNEKMGS